MLNMPSSLQKNSYFKTKVSQENHKREIFLEWNIAQMISSDIGNQFDPFLIIVDNPIF